MRLSKWLILLLTILPLLYLPVMIWQMWHMAQLLLQDALDMTAFYGWLAVNMAVCVLILIMQAWYVYDATRRDYPNGDRERGKWLLALCVIPLLPNVLYWYKFIFRQPEM